jgi:hypothetical protein
VKGKEKTELRKSRYKWEENIKISLKEIVGDFVDWVHFSR